MAIPPFGPIDRPDNGELPPPVEAPDTIGWNIPAEAITVAQAREICMGLESGEKTDISKRAYNRKRTKKTGERFKIEIF